MFSGTLPSLIDSQRVSPRLFANGLFRETSFAAGKRPVHPRMFHSLYNRKKPALHHHSPSEEEDVSSRISRTLLNQQDSLESARLNRISKILSNRQDYLESARLPNPTDTRPRLLVTESSPSTAVHSLGVSAVSLHPSSKGFPDFSGFVGY